MRKLHPLILSLVLTATGSSALADEKPIEARYLGYPKEVVAPEASSTGTIWLMLGGLGLVCLGPLFMNAKRTHLD